MNALLPAGAIMQKTSRPTVFWHHGDWRCEPSLARTGTGTASTLCNEAQAPTAEMAVTPPSIRKSAPTTYAESSDARYTASFAISNGAAIRLLGLDIIGDSVYLLYAHLYNPPRQTARVSGRDRTDARRGCACAAGFCCGLCRPLSTRQDLGRQGAPTPERRRRPRCLITDGRQTALHPRLSEDQSAANDARLAI